MWNVLVLGFALVFLEMDSVAFLHFGLLCLRRASWPPFALRLVGFMAFLLAVWLVLLSCLEAVLSDFLRGDRQV